MNQFLVTFSLLLYISALHTLIVSFISLMIVTNAPFFPTLVENWQQCGAKIVKK